MKYQSQQKIKKEIEKFVYSLKNIYRLKNVNRQDGKNKLL